MIKLFKAELTPSIQAPTILGAMSIVVCLLQFHYPDSFGGIDSYTYYIAIIYFSCFSASFYIVLFFSRITINKTKQIFYLARSHTRIAYALLLFLTLLLFILHFKDESFYTFAQYRIIIINGYYKSNIELLMFARVATLFFFFSLLLYFIDNKYKKTYLTFIFLIPLIMTNRNFFLIFFIFYFYKVAFIEKKHLKLLTFFFLALSINIFYVWAFDKGISGQGIIPKTLESILSYFVMPIHGFSYHIENFGHHDNTYYGDFLTLPGSIVTNLGFNVERNFLYTPEPYSTNVYTLFFGIHYDFGFLGILISSIFFGAFHAILYAHAKYNIAYLYVYLFSLYPLIMSYFDNVYTTSPGTWLYLLLPLLFLKRITIK